MLAFSQVGSKRSPSPDLTWTNETFSASQYKMLPFMSVRRQLQTKGFSDSISSNIRLRFWVLTVCFWDLLQQLFACTEWDVNLSRLQSDHMIKLGHIAIAAANMTEIVATPTTLDIQLATAGAKNSVSRWNAIPSTSVKTAPTGLHRFDFDGMRQAHGGHLKHLESTSFSCLHGEQDNLTRTQLLVMQSATIHMATRTVCIMCENCHVIIFCKTYM